MAALELSTAVATLRSLLGDAQADKYEFRVGAQPAPDGLTKKFFLGQTRLMESSIQPFLNGVPIASSGFTLDPDTGTMLLSTAPAPSGTLETSYYYRWFTDSELCDFLTQGANVLRFDTIEAEDMPVGLRPAAYDFACFYAFMRKAAEYANSLEASAGGLMVSEKAAAPNWKALADAAFKSGKEKLILYAENPLGAKTAGMRFVTFDLPAYQPRGYR